MGYSTATITIPVAGAYTFGVTTDEGFRLTVGGATFSGVYSSLGNAAITSNGSITAVGTGTPVDTFGVVNFSAAGTYTLQLEWFNRLRRLDDRVVLGRRHVHQFRQ